VNATIESHKHENSAASVWAVLALGVSIALAANSFSNYSALNRHIAVSDTGREPSEQMSSGESHLAGARISRAVWVGAAPEQERMSRHKPGDELRHLKRGLLINASLALVLMFAVAANGGHGKSTPKRF
jgi:hypothetical protein